jgi:hypothetical protein
MILKIGKRGSFAVTAFAEASAVYARVRDLSLEGASTFPDGTIHDGRRIIARVSYNAKIWPPTKWHQGLEPLFNPYG